MILSLLRRSRSAMTMRNDRPYAVHAVGSCHRRKHRGSYVSARDVITATGGESASFEWNSKRDCISIDEQRMAIFCLHSSGQRNIT
jgi:hypothetical protein